jgi:hypothetical protein
MISWPILNNYPGIVLNMVKSVKSLPEDSPNSIVN